MQTRSSGINTVTPTTLILHFCPCSIPPSRTNGVPSAGGVDDTR